MAMITQKMIKRYQQDGIRYIPYIYIYMHPIFNPCGIDRSPLKSVGQVLTFLLNFIPEIGAVRLAVRCRWRLKWQAGRKKVERC